VPGGGAGTLGLFFLSFFATLPDFFVLFFFIFFTGANPATPLASIEKEENEDYLEGLFYFCTF
jgi:hypothetical protein